MSKPSDDLSALFRSLRPDDSVAVEGTAAGAHKAEQRWPLLNAVAPEKPQDTPALSALERQHWKSQEKPEGLSRKPALSLPGLSDKMAKGLDNMSMRAVKGKLVPKAVSRREPEEYKAERVVGRAPERMQSGQLESPKQVEVFKNSVPISSLTVPVEAAKSDRSLGRVLDRKNPNVAQGLLARERSQPEPDRADGSLKSIFSRLEAKPGGVVKPVGARSSFLDRLGKR